DLDGDQKKRRERQKTGLSHLQTFPRQNMTNTLEQNPAIEAETPVIDIPHIQLHPASEVQAVSSLQNPQAREARFHSKTAALPPLVLPDLVGQRRSRAHQRHVAPEDVKNLGPFVD